MSKIGVGIIGAGGIAALWHLPELAAIDDFDVRVLAGRNPERLRRLQANFGGRIARNYQEVIESADVDAVIVATPHPLHVELGVAVLRAGKHLMMQKPLCGDMKEADRFARAAEKARGVVFCLPHFAADFHAARTLIDAGTLGVVSGASARTSHGGPELYYAKVRRYFGETDNDLWFFDADRAAVGALFDMGVYAVAQLVALLGRVVEVQGYAQTLAKPTRLEDCASLLLRFERGCIGCAETSWCDPAWTWTAQVHGTRAKLTTGSLHESRLTLVTPTALDREDAPVDTQDIPLPDIGNAHQSWLRCITASTEPALSHWRGARHITEVLLAGLESSRQQRPVAVSSQP